MLCAGTAQGQRRRLKLPTLAEEPLKEGAAQQDLANSKALTGVPNSKSAAEKDALADTPLHPVLASDPAGYEEKKVYCQIPIPHIDYTYESDRHA